MLSNYKSFLAKINEPSVNVQLHKWATLIWLLLIPVTLIWLKDSLVWIALMSAYANFSGHWSCYCAVKAEKKADEKS